MGWAVFLSKYRDGEEVAFDIDLARQIMGRYNVEGLPGTRLVHRDPLNVHAVTEFVADEYGLAIDRPCEGELWEMIYALMVECELVLYDPTECYVAPSQAVAAQLPEADGWRSVHIANKLADLHSAEAWPENPASRGPWSRDWGINEGEDWG